MPLQLVTGATYTWARMFSLALVDMSFSYAAQGYARHDGETGAERTAESRVLLNVILMLEDLSY